ncbi:hypothetical protein PPTG_21144 [Phytophthora nicotianae INRA-310]|uniref:Reverse transcriptase domain-containing protein n=1 Tax=Phytophthora nicotianae (strain INRA-310) TaxID=761204 RepID=W2RAT5_PHYN3|nr:hypothetical protein PPTG_21144 [Phytophthora nicotianae INRA-310]ETN21784.1 hypothetical protein PPTG_21144 [Phytophthora nicotianae INRA-310]
MPVGLCNAVPGFERLMENVLVDLKWRELVAPGRRGVPQARVYQKPGTLMGHEDGLSRLFPPSVVKALMTDLLNTGSQESVPDQVMERRVEINDLLRLRLLQTVVTFKSERRQWTGRRLKRAKPRRWQMKNESKTPG